MHPLRLCAAWLALTPLAAANAESYRFAVVGHLRGGPGDGNLPTAKLERLVEELRAQAPDFVVLTGDIVWGDFEAAGTPDTAAIRRDFESIDALLARVGAPIHHVPGNHDVWDAATRDLWLERYGALQRSFEHRGSRFVLLNSCWTPGDAGGRTPGKFIRGAQLDGERLAFAREQLTSAGAAEHVFVFQHHLLWWDDGAAWWKDVHPLLAPGRVRAVFGGDMGPGKFARLERDGVQYVQSAVDFTDRPPLEMLRNREESRALASQLDNYLLVHVDGPAVRLELRVVEALTSEAFSPAAWREVYAYDVGSFERRVFNRMNTPERAVGWLARVGLAAGLGGALLGGLLALLWTRRRRAA
jgi:hypothetical protein